MDNYEELVKEGNAAAIDTIRDVLQTVQDESTRFLYPIVAKMEDENDQKGRSITITIEYSKR